VIPGINVNVPDIHNHTPLWHACSKGHTRIAKLILALGKNVDTTGAKEASTYNISEHIEEYERDPEVTKIRLRMELGV
jgi:ankyrin repeat protein